MVFKLNGNYDPLTKSQLR